MLKTIFRWATKNRKITSNPAVDLTYLAKVDPRKERQDFTQADLRLILTEARKAANPVVRISNLIATFSGARLAEIVEADKADFEWDGGHLVFHIRLDNREEGQGLKNHISTPRRFPLHSAIKDEIGEYLVTLPANSPLFPNVKVDRDGKRSHNAGNAQCGKSACCVRRGGGWKRGRVEMLRPQPARQPSTLLRLTTSSAKPG
jgi:integrase